MLMSTEMEKTTKALVQGRGQALQAVTIRRASDDFPKQETFNKVEAKDPNPEQRRG